MLAALMSPDARLRANVATYLLPLPLAMDSNSLPVLLERTMACAGAVASRTLGNGEPVGRGRVCPPLFHWLGSVLMQWMTGVLRLLASWRLCRAGRSCTAELDITLMSLVGAGFSRIHLHA